MGFGGLRLTPALGRGSLTVLVVIAVEAACALMPVGVSAASSRPAGGGGGGGPTVLSTGTATLHGTWSFNFDSGTEVGSQGDVFWEQHTAVVRSLDPQNLARIVNVGVRDFDATTYELLATLAYSSTPIDGNADATNQLVVGDIFAVRTNAGNLAKAKVVTYGYDLQIQWVTWAPPGQAASIVSTGMWTLQGTWSFNFDTGAQVSSWGDVFWDQHTATVRSLDPQNLARIANLGQRDYASLSYAELMTLPYGTTPINGNNDSSNQLGNGDVFAVRTDAGNIAKVQVVTYGYDLQIQWTTLAPAEILIGTVSSGTGTLHGTWSFNFDAGAQVLSNGDVFWDQHTATVRTMDPEGTAQLANLGTRDFGSLTYSELATLPYSTSAINGNADGSNQLVNGDVFAVRTNGGNLAKVLIVSYGYDLQIQWATFRPAAAIAALPAMANAAYGGYTTVTYIQNTGIAPATVIILYFDTSGDLVGRGDVKVGLPRNANWTVRQDNGNGLPAHSAGSALIYSDQPFSAFVNEFAPGNTSDATSYTAIQVPDGGGSTLFAPAIASNAYGGYTTGIGLTNVSKAVMDITITYRNPNGSIQETQTLSGVLPGAYRGVYSGNSGQPTDANLPANFSGTATITASAGSLAAIVNEVGPRGQFSSYDAVPMGATSLDAPVALNNAYGGFFTGMAVQNTSGATGIVTVTFYDSSGTPTPLAFTIPGYGYLGLYQGDVGQGPAPSPNGYTAVINSTIPVAVVVNEIAPPAGVATQSTSYNTFAGGAQVSHLALLENAGSDGFNTSVGVMNTAASTTMPTLVYYDANTGLPVGVWQTTSLASNAFWGVYQPSGGLPNGQRATGQVFTNASSVAVIGNETNPVAFMSFGGQ
jgi:hypothetical protein